MKQFPDLSPQAGNISIFSVKRVLLLAIGDHMIFDNDRHQFPAEVFERATSQKARNLIGYLEVTWNLTLGYQLYMKSRFSNDDFSTLVFPQSDKEIVDHLCGSWKSFIYLLLEIHYLRNFW